MSSSLTLKQVNDNGCLNSRPPVLDLAGRQSIQAEHAAPSSNVSGIPPLDPSHEWSVEVVREEVVVVIMYRIVHHHHPATPLRAGLSARCTYSC